MMVPVQYFYDVRAIENGWRTWGRFWLASDGALSILSDYGNYGYWWGSPGGEIRKFLCGAGPDYVTNKLSGGKSEYQDEATERSIRKQILSRRRQRDLTREAAREEWHLINRCNHLSDEHSLWSWAEETKLPYHEFDGVGVYGHPQQLVAFMKILWPAFVGQLQAELAKEETPQHG